MKRGIKNIVKGIALLFLGTISATVIFVFINKLENSTELFKARTATVTYYFMEGCPHCEAMKPEWEKFKRMAVNTGGAIRAVDVSADQNIAKARPKVSGFPTIHIEFNGKVEEYNGKREADAIMAAAKKMMA